MLLLLLLIHLRLLRLQRCGQLLQLQLLIHLRLLLRLHYRHCDDAFYVSCQPWHLADLLLPL
jgi:hypothetical protein